MYGTDHTNPELDKSGELPSYVDIVPQASYRPTHIRTTPVSPVFAPDDSIPTATSSSLVVSASEETSGFTPLTYGPPYSQHHISIEIEAIDENILQKIISSPISQEYYKLQECLPSKELFLHLHDLCESHLLAQTIVIQVVTNLDQRGKSTIFCKTQGCPCRCSTRTCLYD